MLAWQSAWASEAAADVARVIVRKADCHPLTRVRADSKSGEVRTLEGELTREASDRARALTWVGELDGEGRADRIRACGYMELCFHPKRGEVGWRNRWCRDRACPGCAKRRANAIRKQLRAHLEERRAAKQAALVASCAPLCSLAALEHGTHKPAGQLMFVTLTQPKRGEQTEAPGESVSRLLADWRKLSNRRPFKSAVQGYLRATEVTYSRRGFAGWHAHLHLVLELHPDMRRADVERYIRSTWCGIVGGDPKAQNFQALNEAKLGQVVKYITKPFELPAELAPTFFDDMKGRKLISGAGTWRDYAKHDAGYQHAPGWVPQSSHVGELLDAAGRGDGWSFRWLETEQGIRPVCPWRKPGPDEVETTRHVPAIDAWLALSSDCRPVGARCKVPGAARSVALDPGEAPTAERERRRAGAPTAACRPPPEAAGSP